MPSRAVHVKPAADPGSTIGARTAPPAMRAHGSPAPTTGLLATGSERIRVQYCPSSAPPTTLPPGRITGLAACAGEAASATAAATATISDPMVLTRRAAYS